MAPRFAVLTGDSRRDDVHVYEVEGDTARRVFSVERAATPHFLADGTLVCLRNVATEGPEAAINPHSIGSFTPQPHWRIDRFDADGNVIGSLSRPGAILGVHPREDRVLLAEDQHRALGIVDLADGTGPVVRLWAPPGAQCGPLGPHACFSPDGLYVFASSFDALLVLSSDGARRVRFERVHTKHISDLAMSPDGATLVSSSWDKSVRLWNVAALVAMATAP